MLVRPKDYIVAKQDLFFAVLSDYIEADHVLSFLRYKNNNDVLQKLQTDEAIEVIKNSHPEFLYHSQHADIELHGIPIDFIEQVYRPEETTSRLLSLPNPDPKQQDANNVIKQFIKRGVSPAALGITGSLMLDTHNQSSDIDIVVYGRDNFFKVRELIRQGIAAGEFGELDEIMWRDAWQRRACALDFEEYCKYEAKKYNKCLYGQSKVDISMIPAANEKVNDIGMYKKLGREKIIARVIDDTFAYDFPARFYTDHDNIKEVVVYTATYTGQATRGDKIEVSGYLEQNEYKSTRLIVGTSREAKGEYIRVITE